MKTFLSMLRPTPKTAAKIDKNARLLKSSTYGLDEVPPLSAILLADLGPFSAGPGN